MHSSRLDRGLSIGLTIAWYDFPQNDWFSSVSATAPKMRAATGSQNLMLLYVFEDLRKVPSDVFFLLFD